MKFDLNPRLMALAMLASALACAGSTPPSTPTANVFASTDVPTIDNDGTKAVITLVAKDATGAAGTGSVTFTAAYGDLNGTGSPSATVTLDANGAAKASYACNFSRNSSCVAGNLLVNASWNSVAGSVLLSIRAASSPPPITGTDGGVTPPPVSDGGVASVPTMAVSSVFPAFVVTQSGANPAAGLPGTTTVSFVLKGADGSPLPGQTVIFQEPLGESLLTLGATTATTNSSGIASVAVSSKDTPGRAQVLAVVGNGLVTATATVPILGPPTIITWVSTTPDVLGIKGSGIQEHGLMTFQVTDALGTPVPQTAVTLSQGTPSLVTIDRTSLVTDDKGQLVATYASGLEVGVSSIVATVVVTGAQTTHPIAVRGAKPSGSGFYFRCDRANLPVYTTTTGIQQVTCTVRLTDRYGNRVGIPVPVSFATEAGAISASVTTKGFDFSSPSSPDEGTATVTFTTDLSDGHRPADVQPLANEPKVTVGGVTYNPRDQLVTIIAMTAGEEGFIDANHNGQLDPGENFIDQGDPFVDANDDGVWQSDELRFCGSGDTTGLCPVYQGPNGKWDSLTTIWKPTWVVFTGPGVGTTTPAGGATPQPPCADFSDSQIIGGHSPTVTAPIYVYDFSLNPPASGTTSSALNLLIHDVPPAFGTSGFGLQLDAWGAMGLLGFDFDYKLFTAAGGPCTAGSGACVEKLVFNDFDPGLRGIVNYTNPDTLPAGMSGNGCAPNANGQPVVSVPVEVITVTNNVSTSATIVPVIRASSAPNGLKVTGAGLVPSSIYTGDGAQVGLATVATLTFVATDASGAPLVGKTVTFSESGGALVLSAASAVTDASGSVTVMASATQITNVGSCAIALSSCSDVVTATLPYGAASGSIRVPILSSASAGIQIVSQGAVPSAIYPSGGATGLPNSTVLTFFVHDKTGLPLANVPVSFASGASYNAPVTLSSSVASTDATGRVSVTATARSTAGVAAVTATLPNAIASVTAPISILDPSQISLNASPVTSIYTANTFGLPTSTGVNVKVVGMFGDGLPGITVTFAEASGEALLGPVTASAVTDSNGIATVLVTSTSAPGTAHLVASAVGATVTAPIVIIGAPSSIVMATMAPSFLGLQGSGVQESGTMTFKVTDAAGSPVPGVPVDFGQGVPALVTLAAISGTTDSTGSVRASYSSGNAVGVSTVTATIRNTTTSTAQTIAVRGAKPSAAGLYFRCSKVNLAAYDTTTGLDSTTCTVRLSDRFGNRVGIPTAVSFATEAGSIAATATTQGFTFANPNDPNEGTATVTLTTDMGNGFKPADVAPLAANPAQIPYGRAAEPQCAPGAAPSPACNPPPAGGPTLNPRDQLVTIIAMVRGEEAFTDNNLNGVWDANESFVDQGDPFVDANDNGIWDSNELRFCGAADCQQGTVPSAYHAGNGTWDGNRIIWAPTWVVFSGGGMATSALSCIDYANNTAADPSSITAKIYALDPWLNTPVSGTQYSVSLAGAANGLTMATAGLFSETDQWGALGFLGYDFDYIRVGETCTSGSCVPDPTKSCNAASGGTNTGCMQALLFYHFDDGQRGTATITDANKLPAGVNGGACVGTAGTSVENYWLQATETGSTQSGSFTWRNEVGGTAGF